MAQEIIMYGTTWCGDCHRSRRLLDRLEIEYTWIDVDEDETALAYIKTLNNGKRVVPTIVFADGDVLIEPSDPELLDKVGDGR